MFGDNQQLDHACMPVGHSLNMDQRNERTKICLPEHACALAIVWREYWLQVVLVMDNNTETHTIMIMNEGRPIMPNLEQARDGSRWGPSLTLFPLLCLAIDDVRSTTLYGQALLCAAPPSQCPVSIPGSYV